MSKANNYIWTIRRRKTGEDKSSVNYYNQITKVRKFVNLLVCAGYNETLDLDDIGFIYQSWQKDGIFFTIDRHLANVNSLSRLI